MSLRADDPAAKVWLCVGPACALAFAQSGYLALAPNSRTPLLGRDGVANLFDFHSREFELRNFAKRVHRGVGQDIGRRLDIGEGQEHHIGGHRAVGSRHDLDRTAARGQPQHAARCNVKFAQCAGMQRTVCLWLHRIQNLGPPRHRPGVPMLQLPSRGQNHRIVGIGRLVGRNHLGGGEFCAVILAREPVGKDYRLTRIGGGERRIGHRAFGFQPVPSDVVERFHQQAHFGKNL